MGSYIGVIIVRVRNIDIDENVEVSILWTCRSQRIF